MEKIVFTDEYLFNDKIIDEQHKYLVDKSNFLLDNYDKIDTHEIKKSIIDVYKFFKKHFNDEEKLMKQKNYPKYIIHRSEHDKLIDKLNKVVEMFEPTSSFALIFALFLQEWLSNHFLLVDKKFADFLNSNIGGKNE